MVYASSGPITGGGNKLVVLADAAGPWIGHRREHHQTGDALRMIQRNPCAQRTAPGMHHEDRFAHAKLFKRLIDHPPLSGRRRIRDACARAPAMAGTVDQDHAMIFREPVPERLPHHLEIRTSAMQHHDRQTGGVARADIDDAQGRAGDLDHLPLRGISALNQQDTGLRGQRQNRECRHDNHCHHRNCPDDPLHRRATAAGGAGFAAIG
jgi:hypothetical protein